MNMQKIVAKPETFTKRKLMHLNTQTLNTFVE